MKKIILLMMLSSLLGVTQTVAQEYEYLPFVREGVKWVYSVFNSDNWNGPVAGFPVGLHYFNLELKGERDINGKTYKAMHKYSGSDIDPENDTIPIYLREEGKVVYGIIPDGRIFYDCPINSFALNEYSGEEFILYDFYDQDTFWESRLNRDEVLYDGCQSIDTIQLGTHQSKRYTNLYRGNEFYCIEGVGIDQLSCGYTLYYFMGFCPTGLTLSFNFCYLIENGEIIYKGQFFDPGIDVIDEVVAEQPQRRQYDDNYYNLMGQALGKELPTTPGIYIHHGNKVIIR